MYVCGVHDCTCSFHSTRSVLQLRQPSRHPRVCNNFCSSAFFVWRRRHGIPWVFNVSFQPRPSATAVLRPDHRNFLKAPRCPLMIQYINHGSVHYIWYYPGPWSSPTLTTHDYIALHFSKRCTVVNSIRSVEISDSIPCSPRMDYTGIIRYTKTNIDQKSWEKHHC